MDERTQQTLVVIPAFNEEASLAAVLVEIQKAIPGMACLVVDDGSYDKTVEIAQQHNVEVAQLPFNMGVGAAMRTGFRFAKREGYLNVVQVDADGQHNPADLPLLISRLEDADIVIGARFAGKGSYEVRGPRKWSMKLLSTFFSQFSKTQLSDTTSGFRASGPRAVSLFAEHYPSEYLGDTVESLVIALKSGLTVVQVPVEMRMRNAGTPSHNPAKSAIYLLRVFMALVISLTRRPPRNQVSE